MDPSMYETSDTIDTHSILVLQTLHEELPESTWKIFRIIHIILASCGLLGNCVLLLVVYGLVSKLTPPIQLVTNLSFANMLAAWAVVTMYFPHTSCQEEIQTGLLVSAHNATALTLFAYVVAYHIAIFRPLEYSIIVTRRRVWVCIAVIWCVSLLSAHVHFFTTLISHDHHTLFCYQVFNVTYIPLGICVAISGLLLLVSAYVITHAHLYLRPVLALIDPVLTPANGTRPTEPPRRSNYETNTILISLTLYIVTWLPYLIAAFAHCEVHNTSDGFDAAVAMFSFMCFVELYCVACPIIFALRLDSIMAGYDKLYLKLRVWGKDSWGCLSSRMRREDHSSSPLNPIESVF